METLKNFIVLTNWFIIVAVITVVLTVLLLFSEGSVEGINLISPITVGAVVAVIMLMEGTQTFGKSISWIGFLFHTLVFAGVIGIAYSMGKLDGYTSWQRGVTYYGSYDEIATAVSAKEWYVFYGGYVIRVLLQIVSLIVCIFGKRKQIKEVSETGKEASQSEKHNLSFASPVLALWFILGIYSLLVVGPKPQSGGYYSDNFDSFSIEQLSKVPVVGAYTDIYKPLHWIIEPQTDQNFGWDNGLAMLVGIFLLGVFIYAANENKWWSELAMAIVLIYIWSYFFVNVAYCFIA